MTAYEREDLTKGSIQKGLLRFALPLIAGNLLQQCYNIADAWIVGRYIGEGALAAVGSAYTLMMFLTSVLIGLCMGSSAYFSIQFGRQDRDRLLKGVFLSFVFIGSLSVVVTALSVALIDPILRAMQTPADVYGMMRRYLGHIFWGIPAIFGYNFFSNLLRAVGNSMASLALLGVSTVLNIALDLLFVLELDMGVEGAALATVIAQYAACFCIAAYALLKRPDLRVGREHMAFDGGIFRAISGFSLLTCVQQSVMNFGILMIQGLVNSFGTDVMAAFAAGVKIDSFAYRPAIDFGNAFSTFVAQNHGAGQQQRIRQGVKSAVLALLAFCTAVTALVCAFAAPLLGLFIDASRPDIIAIGVGYLRIEASFYFGIGLLSMSYGYYRAMGRPGFSVVLTICSLGTRVLLAYLLAPIPAVGVTGVWAAIPIGWLLADCVAAIRYVALERRERRASAQPRPVDAQRR